MGAAAASRFFGRPRGFIKPARPTIDWRDPINIGLIGWWLLGDAGPNGATGTPAFDISGFRNHGAPTSTLLASRPTAHGIGLATSFTGGWFDLGSSSLLSLVGGPFSISAWIQPTGGDIWGPIIANGDSTGYRFQRDNGNSFLNFSTRGLSSGDMSGTVNVFDGKWHHAVAVFTGSAKQIWVDGVLDTQVTGVTGALNAGAFNAMIGKQPQNSRRLQAGIENLRIVFGRYFTPQDIARLYAQPYAGLAERGKVSRLFKATTSSGASATIVVTEANDNADVELRAKAQGSIAATEGADTADAELKAKAQATVAATEDADAADAELKAKAQATVAATEDADAADAELRAKAQAAIAATEDADAADIRISGPGAMFDLQEGSDSADIEARAKAQAAIAATEADDAADGELGAKAKATIAATEDADAADAELRAKAQGAIAATEDGDSAAIVLHAASDVTIIDLRFYVRPAARARSLRPAARIRTIIPVAA